MVPFDLKRKIASAKTEISGHGSKIARSFLCQAKTREIASVKTFQSLFKQKFHREHQNKFQRNFLRKICLGIVTTLRMTIGIGIEIEALISGLEFQLLSRLKGIVLTVTKTSLPIQRKELGRIKDP